MGAILVVSFISSQMYLLYGPISPELVSPQSVGARQGEQSKYWHIDVYNSVVRDQSEKVQIAQRGKNSSLSVSLMVLLVLVTRSPWLGV